MLNPWMSEALTSTVPPCDSRKATRAQICSGGRSFVITGKNDEYYYTADHYGTFRRVDVTR